MPCGRNGDRVTGEWWSGTSSRGILYEAVNWTLKYDDLDDIDLMVRGLARALPDAFGPSSHRLTDSGVRETIPGQMVGFSKWQNKMSLDQHGYLETQNASFLFPYHFLCFLPASAITLLYGRALVVIAQRSSLALSCRNLLKM